MAELDNYSDEEKDRMREEDPERYQRLYDEWEKENNDMMFPNSDDLDEDVGDQMGKY